MAGLPAKFSKITLTADFEAISLRPSARTQQPKPDSGGKKPSESWFISLPPGLDRDADTIFMASLPVN